MDKLTLAYLAGAMDSDGYFSIKRSTYHRRVRKDAINPVYSERIGLKQIYPVIPALLHSLFGGYLSVQKPQTPNSKPQHSWQATDKKAATACKALLPYLRLKRPQAELLLELRHSKDDNRYKHHGYWFERANPDWRDMEMLTTTEVCSILGYTNPASASQAARNGLLLALPYNHDGCERPRYPAPLVKRVAEHLSNDGRATIMPPELVAWRESLYQQVRELNKMGVNGTPVYHRTGPYTPVDG